jgi:hypothetical protein
LEDEHDTSLKKEHECKAEIPMISVVAFWAHVPIPSLQSCPHYTQWINHIIKVCKTVMGG